MHRKGVCYDVGIVMGVNWRPVFEPANVRRELSIIHRDLHCTAVRIVGRSLKRLEFAAEAALEEGLEVWFSPERWNRDAASTARSLVPAARVAEKLRRRFPGRVVFVVASEATLFQRGIIPGRTFHARLRRRGLVEALRSGGLAGPLNRLLGTCVTAVRGAFGGPVTYAALAWEPVDWSPFDLVGVDHYRTGAIEGRYLDMLRPALATGKPVAITEFGYNTAGPGPDSEGFLDSAGLKPSPIDVRSQLLHQAPVIGPLIRPHLARVISRDEHYQAVKLAEQLEILEGAGVDGTFVAQFESQITPYDPEPRYDLDRASSSLVRYLEHGRGARFPDMPWEPKEAFDSVAGFYASH